jgi:hypothetical protein
MTHRLSAALSRLFPSNNQSIYSGEMADRAIAWLAECGYQIVPKDQVMLAPAVPATEELQRSPELH